MASRRLVPVSVRDSLLGIPSDIGSLERNYVLPDEDLDLISTRRRPENRLGLAVHIALLRHPGQGWLDGLEPPAPLIAWLAEQVRTCATVPGHQWGESALANNLASRNRNGGGSLHCRRYRRPGGRS